MVKNNHIKPHIEPIIHTLHVSLPQNVSIYFIVQFMQNIAVEHETKLMKDFVLIKKNQESVKTINLTGTWRK